MSNKKDAQNAKGEGKMNRRYDEHIDGNIAATDSARRNESSRKKISMKNYEKYSFLYHLNKEQILGFHVMKTKIKLRKAKGVFLLLACSLCVLTMLYCFLILLSIGGAIKYEPSYGFFVACGIASLTAMAAFIFTALGEKVWEDSIYKGKVRPRTRIWKP